MSWIRKWIQIPAVISLGFFCSGGFWSLLCTVVITSLDPFISWLRSSEQPILSTWDLVRMAFGIWGLIFILSCLAELLIFARWRLTPQLKGDGQKYPIPVVKVHAAAIWWFLMAFDMEVYGANRGKPPVRYLITLGLISSMLFGLASSSQSRADSLFVSVKSPILASLLAFSVSLVEPIIVLSLVGYMSEAMLEAFRWAAINQQQPMSILMVERGFVVLLTCRLYFTPLLYLAEMAEGAPLPPVQVGSTEGATRSG
ncbi:hypothetical protein FQN52_006245 [Onygenales sp. PD_12]|nr:hypothetical protein FQN52_006245 [Onygenales sp. PD_12]